MRRATGEWLAKAEADFISALREYRARKQPNFDAACFFAQQCAEKYLKAYLQEQTVAVPRTHDLVQLTNLAPEKQHGVSYLSTPRLSISNTMSPLP